MSGVMMEISGDENQSSDFPSTMNSFEKILSFLDEDVRKNIHFQMSLLQTEDAMVETHKLGENRHPERKIAKSSKNRSRIPRPTVSAEMSPEEGKFSRTAVKRQHCISNSSDLTEEDFAKKRRTNEPLEEPAVANPPEVKSVFERLYALRKMAPRTVRSQATSSVQRAITSTVVRPKIHHSKESIQATVTARTARNRTTESKEKVEPNVFERLYSLRKQYLLTDCVQGSTRVTNKFTAPNRPLEAPVSRANDPRLPKKQSVSDRHHSLSRNKGFSQLRGKTLRPTTSTNGVEKAMTGLKFNISIYEKYGSDREKLEVAKSALDYFQLEVITNEGGYTWFETGTQNGYIECEGFLTLNWKGRGYKTFLDILMKKYPDSRNQLSIDDKILLGKEVTKISWNTTGSNNAVMVVCADDSKYSANHLIFTPSLGVLKEQSDTIFFPKLPYEKQKVIEELGYGPVMKVVLHYQRKWWEGSSDSFSFIWSEEDKINVAEDFLEPNYNGRSWVTYMPYVLPVEKNPNVLVAWFVGPLIPKIELIPEETFSIGLTHTFRRFMSHSYNITEPDKILKTQWYTNPHFRGSYSFKRPDRDGKKRKTSAQDDLAAPLRSPNGRPILQFAGEATHPHYYSNVHGAVESGFREADLLIDYYGKR